MKSPTRAGTGAATKVAGFAAVLAIVFGGAWAAGAQVGRVGTPPGPERAIHGTGHSAGAAIDTENEDEMNQSQSTGSGALPGLAVAQNGYRLVLTDTTLEPGSRQVAFRVVGPEGQPVTAFDVAHEKQLHLIVVRRDHTGFQHLHPRLDETTGTWTAEADLTAGAWRVFADFTVTNGPALVLGGDLLVPGRLEPPVPTGEVRTDTLNGYTVTVDGALRPGDHAALTLSVTKNGAPVTDLQPYLGAYGHLVALREGDLAYLHVHPGGEPGDGKTEPGPEIEFGAEVPSAGRYHLYLDFRHDDVVHTAHLVLDAGAEGGAGQGEPDDHRHAH
jgi:hypothetical protein